MVTYSSILLLEDEPLILMDLEYAAQDRGCEVHSAINCQEAAAIITGTKIDVAVLDVSLGAGETCLLAAQMLAERGIPFILHSGDLDRYDETIRTLDAELMAKPAAAENVIAAALSRAQTGASEGSDKNRLAAE